MSNKVECFRGTVACPTSISDHFIIATNLIPRGVKLRKPATYVKTRKFQEIDSDVLDNIYDAKDIWTEVLGFDDINDCVNCFNEVLLGLMDTVFPA